MLGHTGFADTTYYELETMIGNINLLSEELLGKVNQLIIEGGHKLVKKKPDEPLRGRCDSFVVETDVHYPTDVSLLYDSMRCMIRSVSRLARKNHIKGWRQWLH